MKEERTMSAQENKAIRDMTHEEVAAALPKLREEATRADARVHAAMEQLAETAEVPTYVEVHEDHLVVDVRGTEKVMTLLSRLRIPLEHVRGAEADPEIEHTLWRGWRIPGVHVAGVRFYDVHGHRDRTIVIRLKDEAYDRLIVEVQEPAEVVAKINDAVEAFRHS
jgi:ribosomal protein L29